MAKRKTTRKTKSSALGDDPLAWVTNDVTEDKTDIKKTQVKKTKTPILAVKKTQKKKAIKKKKPMSKKAY